jgi:hypothetical protein
VLKLVAHVTKPGKIMSVTHAAYSIFQNIILAYYSSKYLKNNNNNNNSISVHLSANLLAHKLSMIKEY